MSINVTTIDEGFLHELELRLQTVEGELQALKTRIMSRPLSLSDVEPRLSGVIAVTQELFGAPPTVELVQDPEDPEFAFFVFSAKYSGDPKDAVNKHIDWHDRISKVSPGDSDLFRLCLIPE